jgi:hypothetical protein
LQAQLDKLNEALSQDLSATNKMLLAKKIQPISMVQTKR